jgi:hypothetical protein
MWPRSRRSSAGLGRENTPDAAGTAPARAAWARKHAWDCWNRAHIVSHQLLDETREQRITPTDTIHWITTNDPLAA